MVAGGGKPLFQKGFPASPSPRIPSQILGTPALGAPLFITPPTHCRATRHPRLTPQQTNQLQNKRGKQLHAPSAHSKHPPPFYLPLFTPPVSPIPQRRRGEPVPSGGWQSPSPTAGSLAGLSPGAGPEAEQGEERGGQFAKAGIPPHPRVTLAAGTPSSHPGHKLTPPFVGCSEMHRARSHDPHNAPGREHFPSSVTQQSRSHFFVLGGFFVGFLFWGFFLIF